jgi:hypothetical protein
LTTPRESSAAKNDSAINFLTGALRTTKFAQGHDRPYGWQVTMTIRAVAWFVLFMVSSSPRASASGRWWRCSPRRSRFTDLLKNRPWIALVACFSLSAVNASILYLLPPTATWAMLANAVTGSLVYAPRCAIMWAMHADAADCSEWQTS